MAKSKTVFIIMGVSGTGKSTIGKLLSKALDIPFFDGDDFHPQANIDKMASGKPLNNEDRYDWLVALNQLSKKHKEGGAIIACSALKSSYRKILNENMDNMLQFIYLEGTFELVKSRMEKRTSHFMPTQLLKSQFETLEPPKNAITVSIENTPQTIVSKIVQELVS